MNTWLVKTEPSTYSFEDLVKAKRTRWDGVANPVAVKNLRAIKKGDAVLVYHTGDVKACVGLAKAASDGYDDPKDPKLAVVDLEADRALAKPVTLAAIKARDLFKDFALVRQGRLSVMQVPADLWAEILRMSS